MRYLLLLILLASASFAHLEAGVDKQEGPYLLDLGWEPKAPIAGEPAFFAINIVDYESQNKTNFSSAWVRFSKGDRIAFAGDIGMDEGSGSFSYEFPEAGAWEMDVKFANYSEKVEIFVPGEKAKPDNFLWLGGGALVGGAIVLIWRQKKS
jgi:hypothetical protein